MCAASGRIAQPARLARAGLADNTGTLHRLQRSKRMACARNMFMATAALIALAGPAASLANAEFKPDQRWSGPGYQRDVHYRGGPYYVAGAGDNLSRRPYWGGPFFVSCPGNNPPYETHYPRCRSLVKIAVHHRRQIKVHLK